MASRTASLTYRTYKYLRLRKVSINLHETSPFLRSSYKYKFCSLRLGSVALKVAFIWMLVHSIFKVFSPDLANLSNSSRLMIISSMRTSKWRSFGHLSNKSTKNFVESSLVWQNGATNVTNSSEACLQTKSTIVGFGHSPTSSLRKVNVFSLKNLVRIKIFWKFEGDHPDKRSLIRDMELHIPRYTT